jgi:hypothetical protein
MPRPSSTSASRLALAARGLVWVAVALGVALVLDRLAFSRRASLYTANTGRWAYQEWRMKQAAAETRPSPPQILFLGDSTMSRDLRPSLIAPRAQNLARSGLQGIELAELDTKLLELGYDHPRVIVLALLPEQFRPSESDLAFLDHPRPGLFDVLKDYYRKPNQSQVAFFPGTRVVKYRLDALVARLDRDRTYRVDADGAVLYGAKAQAPGAPVRMPGFMASAPGFLNPAKLAPLEAFVRFWEARGTLLVYLFPPLHPSLAAAYESRFSPDLALYRAEVTRIFRGRVIHLETPPPDTAFYDATHLNADGAAAFSRQVGEALRPYLAEAGLPPAGNPSAPPAGL